MENTNIGSIRHIKETSDLFWAYQEKHGDYFLMEYGSKIKEVFGFLFYKMSTQELREMAYLPDNYFGSLMRAELRKRRAKVKLLKAHGRLCRKERQVCLIK
ncbi:hypothetical protein [Sporosarcina sp. FSL K6-3457]|uniref:hypothetical protein n=1 Tax=Sporosarcina sp. FSL K6-3457 TaxID=2978204 RepID=UPI0030F63A39